MWTSKCEELDNVRGLRFAIDFDSRPATIADVLCGWQNDADFRSLFNLLLAEVPFTAFRWETPAVTTATVLQPFEFVLLDSPDLARCPDPNAFATHFSEADADIAVFPNLGADAILVVPYPVAEPSAYGHLAAFVRLAPGSHNVRHFGRRSEMPWDVALRPRQFGSVLPAWCVVAACPARRPSEILWLQALHVEGRAFPSIRPWLQV